MCDIFASLRSSYHFPRVGACCSIGTKKSSFPTNILIHHKVSEDGISLVSEMMKVNPQRSNNCVYRS